MDRGKLQRGDLWSSPGRDAPRNPAPSEDFIYWHMRKWCVKIANNSLIVFFYLLPQPKWFDRGNLSSPRLHKLRKTDQSLRQRVRKIKVFHRRVVFVPKTFKLQRHRRAVEFRVEPRTQIATLQTLKFSDRQGNRFT